MKASKIKTGLLILITLAAINGLAINVSAQTCAPAAYKIYFIDGSSSSRSPVTEAHPGHKYTLVVLGTDVNLFEARQSWYIASLSSLSATASDARWNVEFSPNQAMDITTVEMGMRCSRNPSRWYALNWKVRLFNR
jgi:hypothetical protein